MFSETKILFYYFPGLNNIWLNMILDQSLEFSSLIDEFTPVKAQKSPF